jgi:hypothetical protein
MLNPGRQTADEGSLRFTVTHSTSEVASVILMPLQPRIAVVILTLKAKHDHLQKVASTRDHVKVISEFVWNALDATCSHCLPFVVATFPALSRLAMALATGHPFYTCR